MNPTHVGSDFDDFLREAGLFAETEAAARKHSATMTGVGETFARQVAEFIDEYRPALEALAGRRPLTDVPDQQKKSSQKL